MQKLFTPFLFRQERCPKEADIRGASSKGAPLWIPRRFAGNADEGRTALYTPSGAGGKTGCSRYFKLTTVASYKRRQSRLEMRLQPIRRRGRVGGLGEGGSKSGRKCGCVLHLRKALRSAHPPAAFFGSFLVRTQEMNTYQSLEITVQSDK